jgi:Tfp pilus assembly protein PilF
MPVRYQLFTCALLLILLTCGCGSSYHRSENLRFGVEVAQKGLWNEAVSRWERVLELDPSNAMAYNNLAVAYEESGKYEKAEEAYRKALELDPASEWINENYRNFKEFYAWYSEQEKEEDGEEEEGPNDED